MVLLDNCCRAPAAGLRGVVCSEPSAQLCTRCLVMCHVLDSFYQVVPGTFYVFLGENTK